MPGPDLIRTAQNATTSAPRTTQAPDARKAGKPYEEGRAELSPEEKKRQAEERAAANKATYEDALGTWLGGELYDQLHKQLAPEKMLKYGDKGADGLVKALVGLLEKGAGELEGADDPQVQDALAKLKPELIKWANEQADHYLATTSGKELSAKAVDWVETHPRTVVSIAILAAIGAVAANVKVPEIKKKFELGGGFSAEAGVSLGKIRTWADESVRASLAYEKGNLKADVSAKHELKDGGSTTTLAAGLKAGGGDRSGELRADGSFTDKGDVTIGLKGAATYGLASGSFSQIWKDQAGKDSATTEVKLRYGDKEDYFLTEGKFASDDTFKLSLEERLGLPGGYSLGGKAQASRGEGGLTDSAGVFGLGYTATQGGTTYNRYATLADDKPSTQHDFSRTDGPLSTKIGVAEPMGGGAASGSLGMKYSLDTLTASLDAKFGKTNQLEGAVDGRRGRLVYGGSLGLNLDSSELTKASLLFGYQDPKAFEAALVEYRYKKVGDVPEDTFKLTLEHELRDIMVRGTAQVDRRDGQFSRGSADLMAMKPMTEDLGLIGGVGHQWGPGATGGTDVRLGVQYKKIPVYVNYDFERKSVGIGITIPFGR